MIEILMFGDIFTLIKKMFILGGVIEQELDLEMFDGELIILLLIKTL
jgi:hypothetical protein